MDGKTRGTNSVIFIEYTHFGNISTSRERDYRYVVVLVVEVLARTFSKNGSESKRDVDF